MRRLIFALIIAVTVGWQQLPAHAASNAEQQLIEDRKSVG